MSRQNFSAPREVFLAGVIELDKVRELTGTKDKFLSEFLYLFCKDNNNIVRFRLEI